MSKAEGKNASHVDAGSSEGGKGEVNLAFESIPGDTPPPDYNASVKKDEENPEEDFQEREQWGKPIEFLLSCIAMSVGLGNIWRFPFIAYKYGGGAFLIPYIIVLTIIGRPMYFLELSLGQFSSLGQTKVWKISPIFKGVGYVAMLGNICVMSFYAVVMAITFFYLFSSMQGTLPWAACNEDWVGLGLGSDTDSVTGEVVPILKCGNDSAFAYEMDGERSNISIAQLFFENEVLKAKYQIDDGLGTPEWRLTLLLFLAWFIIWAALVKGVQATGKVAYFTALFPYVVMFIMLIRGVTLPNAWTGIKYFITPDWERMKEVEVWYQAVQQCFFSLTTGFGVLQMFGSYNPFHHNVNRDAWIVSLMDTFTSLLAGVTIFAVLGNLAGELEVDIDQVALPGPGLTFISFAQGLSKFPAPQVFSILFYLMLLTLGLGTGVAMGGTLVTIILDQWPKLPRWIATTAVCIAMFFSGLIYITPGGFFILDLVDHFGANFVIYVLAIIEVSAVSYVYGIGKFLKDLEFMLGFPVGIYWRFTWAVCIPVGMTGILGYVFYNEKRWTYNGMDYPDIAIACGWALAGLSLSVFPICAIHTVYTRKVSGFKEKFKAAYRPSPRWGPRNPTFRREWVAFKNKNKETSAESSFLQKIKNML